MNDKEVSIAQLKEKVAHFVQERDWNQFHSPKNLSMAIAAEAAELMEKFLWVEPRDSDAEVANNREEVEQEVADVFMYLLSFCNATGIDLAAACEQKLAQNAKKYPVEKAKGKSLKYTKL